MLKMLKLCLKEGEKMKISKESFVKVAEALYQSEEYNEAIKKLCSAQTKKEYISSLLIVLKEEQKQIKSIVF